MATCPEFTVLSICAGVGGLDLGIKIAAPNARTVVYVERESYAASCLVARMEESSLEPALVWDDLTTFDGKPFRGRIHCIAAGLPCQPYSIAGKQLGHDDERAIWPEFIRVVGEVQPFMVFIENVAAFLGYFRPIGSELQRLGYVVEEPLFVTAEECGCTHKRERLFILAHRRTGIVENTERDRCEPWWPERKGFGGGRTSDQPSVESLADSGLQYEHLQQRTHGAESKGIGCEV